MKESILMIKAEIENMMSDNYILKPLDKEFLLQFKETAINYEIALELKSS